jgi:hypothetical protein
MILYVVQDAEGRTHWVHTQGDAKAINKHFEKRVVPTDQPGLMAFLNEMQTQCDEVREAALIVDQEASEIVTAFEAAEPTPALVDLMKAPVPWERDKVCTIIDQSSGNDFVSYTMAALQRLGELGNEGRDEIETYQTLGGVGFNFSQGVHLLALIALTEVAGGPQQFDRILRRDRKNMWGKK